MPIHSELKIKTAQLLKDITAKKASDIHLRRHLAEDYIEHNLTSLDLSWCELDDAKVVILCKSLSGIPAFETLNLSGNNICASMGNLGEMLAQNKTLKTLLLSHNKIDDNAFGAFGMGFHKNSHLSLLDLSHNNITPYITNVLHANIVDSYNPNIQNATWLLDHNPIATNPAYLQACFNKGLESRNKRKVREIEALAEKNRREAIAAQSKLESNKQPVLEEGMAFLVLAPTAVSHLEARTPGFSASVEAPPPPYTPPTSQPVTQSRKKWF